MRPYSAAGRISVSYQRDPSLLELCYSQLALTVHTVKLFIFFSNNNKRAAALSLINTTQALRRAARFEDPTTGT